MHVLVHHGQFCHFEIGNIQKQINSVKQCQSLEEVQRLYDRENYQDVVDLLVTTFTEKQHLKHKISSDIPERHAQLLLLQNSLMNLKDYNVCVTSYFFPDNHCV